VYASSPLAFSFPSRGQNNVATSKCVVVIEGQPGAPVSYRSVPLHAGLALHRRQFPDVEAALTWLRDNQECYVELHIETETYLTAEERKLLTAAHPRIVGPIPVFKSGTNAPQASARAIDLQLSREELFKRYFFQKERVEASDELLELFREITGKEVEA
jgi:DNA repair protein SbcD/Mre11